MGTEWRCRHPYMWFSARTSLLFTLVCQHFCTCGLPPCCHLHCVLIFSVPRQSAQDCPLGCLQAYQAPMLSIYRCSTSQSTHRVNSNRHGISVFLHCLLSLCYPQLHGHLSIFTTLLGSLSLLTHPPSNSLFSPCLPVRN